MIIVIPMATTTKTAISLPTDTFRRAEALRKRKRLSRSGFYAEAIEAFLKAERTRELDDAYIAAYKRRPETDQERADAEAMMRHAAEATLLEDPTGW